MVIITTSSINCTKGCAPPCAGPAPRPWRQTVRALLEPVPGPSDSSVPGPAVDFAMLVEPARPTARRSGACWPIRSPRRSARADLKAEVSGRVEELVKAHQDDLAAQVAAVLVAAAAGGGAAGDKALAAAATRLLAVVEKRRSTTSHPAAGPTRAGAPRQRAARALARGPCLLDPRRYPCGGRPPCRARARGGPAPDRCALGAGDASRVGPGRTRPWRPRRRRFGSGRRCSTRRWPALRREQGHSRADDA